MSFYMLWSKGELQSSKASSKALTAGKCWHYLHSFCVGDDNLLCVREPRKSYKWSNSKTTLLHLLSDALCDGGEEHGLLKSCQFDSNCSPSRAALLKRESSSYLCLLKFKLDKIKQNFKCESHSNTSHISSDHMITESCTDQCYVIVIILYSHCWHSYLNDLHHPSVFKQQPCFFYFCFYISFFFTQKPLTSF